MKLKANNINLKCIKKTFVLQQDQSDCGVACLLSLIQYYNGSSSLEKLRELSGTSKHGTTLLGLYQSANQLGLNASGNESDLSGLIIHGKPLILHVVIEEHLQHYLVCYGFQDDKFIIGDPANGIEWYTKEDLLAVWKTKTCLTLEPNENFVKSYSLKASKKKWFLNLLKDDYKILIFSIILGLGIALLGMVMAIFSQKLIDDILPAKDFSKLITGIILVTVLLFIRILFTALRDYFLIRQIQDFSNRIIDSFYSALLNLPKPFFDTRKIGELVARLNDTQRIQRVISLIVSSSIIDVLVTIVSMTFLFYYSLQTGFIAIISLPIYFLLVYSFNSRIVFAQKEVMQGYALSESNYITSMRGIATIKNNNREHIFRRINQVIYGNYQERIFNLNKINVRLSLFSGLFKVLFLVAILAYTSIQVFYQNMQLGELMAILGIAGSLLPSVANLALVAIPINEAQVAFNRMYEFTSIHKGQEGKENIKIFSSIKMRNVSFRFAGRSPLLRNIDLDINKNECIAIVGESGCGKSTLGQIIQKFYGYENGEILVNGKHCLRKLKTEDWRNLIGVIPQEITIFNGNIIDNILLGKEDNSEEVIQFCRNYGFEKFISELPQGYATILGEEGINLSGGQKQLLAVMRVLYKKPQLLLLDEFTSAMDRKTEQFVLNLLMELRQNMSVIFISHRLHILRKIANRIYIVEDGVIEKCGSHDELLKTDNFYSQFWKNLMD